MNEAPNNQTGLSDTFSSSTNATSNPFTADLKGEFTSNFGTNTNAVSQIFKEGGFASGGDKKKMYIAIGIVVAVLGVVGVVMMSESEDIIDDPLVEGSGSEVVSGSAAVASGSASASASGSAVASASGSAEASGSGSAEVASVEEPAPQPTGHKVGHSGGHMGGAGIGSGKIALAEPADGSSLTYDETQGPATFSWTGGGGWIVFSRSQSMSPPAMKVAVSGNNYSFHHPWPGTWYWKVENKSGSTEVRSFKVAGPQRRNIALSQPASGGSVSGNGGTVSWQGDNKVGFYRVELSSGSWANPQFRFASSGNSLNLSGVSPGQYQMRLGAFSEVAGRWEYTPAIPVTVQ